VFRLRKSSEIAQAVMLSMNATNISSYYSNDSSQLQLFVVNCTKMIWFYPSTDSYRNSQRIAITLNTFLALLSVVLNVRNCKRLLGSRKVDAPVNIVIFSSNISIKFFKFFKREKL